VAVFQQKGPDFILERRNCGKKTLAEIEEVLSGYTRGGQFSIVEATDIVQKEGPNLVPVDVAADQLLEAIERLEIPRGLPLNFIKVQARIRNWCTSQNWNTLGELLQNAGNMDLHEFLAVDNLGRKSATEILEFFDALMGRPGSDLRRFLPVVPNTASILLPLALDDLVSSLDARNTRILEMRLVEGCRLEAISRIFNCTRELVRQIEKRFLDDVERTLTWFSDERVEFWQVWESTGRLMATLADKGSTLGTSLLAAAVSSVFENTPEGILLRDHWLETFRSWGRELMASDCLTGGVDLAKFAKDRNRPGLAWRFQFWLEKHFSEGLSFVEMRATRATRELTPSQKTLLYVGESHALRWQVMYERLKRYHSEHGNANVPNGWKTNPQLAAWVSSQRDRRKRGGMPESEWALLNELGLTWRSRNVGTWEEHLAEVVAFKARHGHCEIPTVLRENPKLGRFVNSMRTQRNRGALSAKRVAQLDAIGFGWTSKKNEREACKANDERNL
jgi:hypothetical protein